MAPRRTSAPPAPALLEWAMGGLGALVVATVLTVIAVEARGPQEPARPEARLESVRRAGAVWLAEVEVRNPGDRTAAAVEVEGRLGDATAHAVLDYVPARGREQVVLAFDADPAAAELSIAGWVEP